MSDKKGCEAEGKAETCEACGAEFRCEPMGNCWCFGETVAPGTLEAIRERFERCLCRECLSKAAQPLQT